ncbi:SLC35C2 [Bugula neritina]|uniref:SLC35C2 n=1 Tax=Bugula neritina TaxID=10212 RepID=A0A7J7J7A9_BUGNE|nr:SLC35C2 [Bugula neritina]
MITTGFIKKGLLTLSLVLFYYFFSIVLTFYNKIVVTKFKYPLVMTYIHLIVKFVLASLVRNILECKKGKSRVTLDWWTFLVSVGPVGITSILDIGLSNWSFEFITVSLYTMTKTSAIVFILIFGLILRVETFRWMQLCVVLCISLGLFLFTFKSTQFNLIGFLMCLAASVTSGLRWGLTQKVAQRGELGLTNPVDFMYHIQPWMICGLLPLAVGIEGLKFSGDKNFLDYSSSNTIEKNMAVLLGGALLAFGLEFSEFLLVMKTSSLTLSVSSMFKECCILLFAHWLYNDEMNYINMLGLVACLSGIALHIYIKATKVIAPERINTKDEASLGLLANSIENEEDTAT